MTSIFRISLNFGRVNKEQLSSWFGNRIIELRKAKGLSQSDLARLCLKDRQGIEKLERGNVNPTLFTIYELANALEISVSELLKH